jgi:hypothetical protein
VLSLHAVPIGWLALADDFDAKPSPNRPRADDPLSSSPGADIERCERYLEFAGILALRGASVRRDPNGAASPVL